MRRGRGGGEENYRGDTEEGQREGAGGGRGGLVARGYGRSQFMWEEGVKAFPEQRGMTRHGRVMASLSAKQSVNNSRKSRKADTKDVKDDTCASKNLPCTHPIVVCCKNSSPVRRQTAVR